MKKVSLLVLICMILSLAFVLASCGEEEHVHEWSSSWVNDGTYHFHTCNGCAEMNEAAKHVDADGDNACDTCKFPIANLYSQHEHEYNTVWAFDDENHFYTCKTCVEVKDSAPHADEDGNNACDDCGYVIDNLYAPHEHAFGENWLFDKDNHFKRCDTCTEVNESASHTDADNNSFCDVCGCIYIPYVAASELADVIETAYENEALVNGGEVFYTYGDGAPYKSHVTTTFTIGKDNLFADYHEHEVRFETYGSVESERTISYNNVNGTLFVYANDNDKVSKLDYQSSDWLYGFAYKSIYGNSGEIIYGLGEVIYTLYEAGVENGSVFANIVVEEDTTYYSFMTKEHIGTDIYEMSVVFTIGEKGNFETADIAILHSYSNEDGDVIYGVADHVYNYSVTQTVGEFSETPTYAPADYILTGLKLADSNAEAIDNNNGFEFTKGDSFAVHINELTPATAVVDIQTNVTTADGVDTWSAYTLMDEENNIINVYSSAVGSFVLDVFINGEETPIYSIPFTVNYAPTTEIGASVNGSEDKVTEASVFAGYNAVISGIAGNNQDASIIATLTGDNAADATLTYNDEDGTYSFTSNVVGVYTVEVKSAVNAELAAVILTITVEEAPGPDYYVKTLHQFIVDDSDYGFYEKILLVFIPTDETTGSGYVYHLIEETGYFANKSEVTDNFTYTIVDGVFTATMDASAEEITNVIYNTETCKFEVEMNGQFTESLDAVEAVAVTASDNNMESEPIDTVNAVYTTTIEANSTGYFFFYGANHSDPTYEVTVIYTGDVTFKQGESSYVATYNTVENGGSFTLEAGHTYWDIAFDNNTDAAIEVTFILVFTEVTE